MPRDHARINLDLWGDDDWMDLSVDAQMLYLTLYTNPGLSFCGAGEWHPGRIAARANDWTIRRVEAAAGELSRRLFIVIDTDTGEYLLRSWIKHDGLWRTPNMAVTVANARGELSSRTLRGVVVFEVAKLKKAAPDSTSWDRPSVQKMLTQNAIDAGDLEPFNPDHYGAANPTSKGGSKGGANPYGHPGANPTSKGGPTPAPTPSSSSYSNGGGPVQTEPHTAPEPTSAASATPGADLVRENITGQHPSPTLTALRIQASELVNTGTDRDIVAAALQLWNAKPGVGNGRTILASLCSEVIKTRASPNRHANGHRIAASDAAFAAAQALKDRPATRLELE